MVGRSKAARTRKLYPRTRREGVYFLLAVIAALATLSGVRAFGPYYTPSCGFKPMRPGDFCISRTGGGGTYADMLAAGERDNRILFVLALPTAVAFGVLCGREIRSRRRKNKALRDLANRRQWSLEPPDPRMPKQNAAAGHPLGLVTGGLDGRTIVVQRYTNWTRLAVNLPVTGLPYVDIGVEPTSGEVRYAGDAAFGQALTTPQVRQAATELGIPDFTVQNGAVSTGRPGALAAADIEATTRALSTLAGTLPGSALRGPATPP